MYAFAVVKLASSKAVTLPIEWDGSSSSVYVTLPDAAVPAAIAFGLSAEIPDSTEKLNLAFPGFKFSSGKEVRIHINRQCVTVAAGRV